MSLKMAKALFFSIIPMYGRATSVFPHLKARPEWLYIKWVTEIIIQERVLNNYTGNQNIPSRAAGENLDALAELVLEQKRPGAKPSGCTVRFYISEPQPTAILIPTGTRVTDTKTRLVWETEADAYVDAGESFVDVHVCCQVVGTAGLEYTQGSLNSWCSGEMLRYHEDDRSRRQVSGV